MARLYHNTTSYFNYYYNAQKLLNEKNSEMDAKYSAPSSGYIDVNYVGTEEELKSFEADMDKIIQKNDVMIYKHPNSKMVDNGRFLNGKAFFYKGQYNRSLENFDEVTMKYSKSRITPQVIYWEAFTYYQMGNKEMTKSILQQYLTNFDSLRSVKSKNKKWKYPKKLEADVALLRAKISIEEKNYGTAIAALEKSVSYIKDKRKRLKAFYLLGQLHAEEKHYADAAKYFGWVEKKTNDYSMAFRAKMRKAHMMTEQVGDGETYQDTYAYLSSLLIDEKNTEYQDQIYYEMGLLEVKQKNIKDGLGFLKKSAKMSKTDVRQKALSFYELGKVYFYNKKEYAKAAMYFDSASVTIRETDAEYREIKKVSSTLKEYMSYKTTIAYQDSLLYLATLSKEDLESVIDAAIADAERKAKEAEEKRKEMEEEAANNPDTGLAANPNLGNTSPSGVWYFDDPAAVSNGRLTFKQQWGNRKDEDNWRRKTKAMEFSSSNPEEPSATPEDSNTVATAPKIAPEDTALAKMYGEDRYLYMKEVPTTEEAKVTANEKIETAMYKLGVLYDQKLMQQDSALRTFEKLLNRYPKTQYILPVQYALYRIYTAKNSPKAQTYKNYIIQLYPKSIYAMLIQGVSPEIIAAEGKEYEFAYSGLFESFSNRQYETSLGFSEYLLNQYKDYTDVELDQVYFIQSLSYGYLGKQDSLKVGLERLIQKFPAAKTKPKAQAILDALNAKSKSTGMSGENPAGKGETAENKGKSKTERSEGGEEGGVNPEGKDPQMSGENVDSETTPVSESQKPPADPNDERFKKFSKDKPTGNYFVVYFLEKGSIPDLEAKNIMQKFLNEKYAGKGLKSVVFNYKDATNKEFIMPYITRFTTAADAEAFMTDLKNSPIHAQLAKKPTDKLMYITSENWNTSFNAKKIADYIEYFEAGFNK